VTYQVIIAPTAARQLHDRLPEAVAWACVEFIRGPLSEEPRRVGVPPAQAVRGTMASPARRVPRPLRDRRWREHHPHPRHRSPTGCGYATVR